ncbi:MAG: DUF3108 domain-containing protein [Elusimicrobiaceae bacterium]|nr:DUF3108 domain-containing protein [Elusimicrobiaceae bacterium]
MSKSAVLFLSCACLLAACHTAKNSPSSPLPVKQQPLPISEEVSPEEPIDQTDVVFPVLATDPLIPVSKDTTEKETTFSKKSEILPKQSEPQPMPLTAGIPAPDKAVFDDEELIDFSDRSLHPFSVLQPNSHSIQAAPWAYEQLKYGLYYTFIKAGTAYIRNRGLVNINGRTAYLLQTTAFSAPVIDAVFKVRDVNQSWLDAEGLFSLGYGQSVREGRYIRDEWITFDYANKQYIGQSKKKKEPKQILGTLEIKVLDMLSSLYFVRSQPLEVGKDLVFDIVNRSKQYPLVVKVLKKEKIKTAAGTFKTIVVEPQIRGEGIFVSKGKSLKVWLTDDEYKMPVKMTVEVFIGSVSAELLEYKRQVPENIL